MSLRRERRASSDPPPQLAWRMRLGLSAALHTCFCTAHVWFWEIELFEVLNRHLVFQKVFSLNADPVGANLNTLFVSPLLEGVMEENNQLSGLSSRSSNTETGWSSRQDGIKNRRDLRQIGSWLVLVPKLAVSYKHVSTVPYQVGVKMMENVQRKIIWILLCHRPTRHFHQ